MTKGLKNDRFLAQAAGQPRCGKFVEEPVPQINNAVGLQGANSSEDVALVQLMLRVVKNAKGQSYYAGNYNGLYDTTLKTAITQFQQDQKLVSTGPAVGMPSLPTLREPMVLARSAEPLGQLRMGSKTWAALVAKLPPEYANICIIPGTKTIYMAGDPAKAELSAATIRTKNDLNAEFREKVAQLVERVYKQHKLVLEVVPQTGWRRDFQSQAAIDPSKTNANAGESPHNFGRAVDLGFASLKWIDGDGQIKMDNYWLDNMRPYPAKQAEFWAARDVIAVNKLGLYKTDKKNDHVHLQSFEDKNVSWGKSLAKLLEIASPTKSKWTVILGNPNNYKVDLGLGVWLTVGDSNLLWNAQAQINKTDLAKALNAKLAVAPSFSVEKFFGGQAKGPPPPVAALPAKVAPPDAASGPVKSPVLKETDINDTQVKYLQTLLQAEIKSADKNWNQWTPVQR